MGLKGQFLGYDSLRMSGRKAISFSITCTNLLQSEVFDAVLVDGSGQSAPQYFRELRLPAKKSFRFDADSCGWYWCQNDFFTTLGPNNKIKERWGLHLPQYAPGECPDCHGSHKCKHCRGKGYVLDGRSHIINTCLMCGDNGVCQTCFIPTRNMPAASQPYGMASARNPAVTADRDIHRDRHIAQLRQRIAELQEKVRNGE